MEKSIDKKEFGKQTATYRQRRDISQRLLSERVEINNAHLNRIEKGIRNPPHKETVIRMAKELHLSDEEKVAYVQLAGYSAQVLEEYDFENEASMTNGQHPTDVFSTIPNTSNEDAQKALQESIPVSHNSADATLIATNLLWNWLWMTTSVLGKHIFTVFTYRENIKRIAMPETIEYFWFVKIQVLKWLEKNHNSKAIQEAKRIILRNPFLRYIYDDMDKKKLEETSFYNYFLRIQHPGEEHSYLHFEVKIDVTRKSDGNIDKFVAHYHPIGTYTIQVIEQKYLELTKAQEHKDAVSVNAYLNQQYNA